MLLLSLCALLLTGCSCDKECNSKEDKTTDVRFDMADSLLAESEYQSALEQYIECLNDYKEQKDTAGMSDCYFQMATAYHRLGDLDQGIEMIRKSIHLDSLTHNIENMSSSYNTLAAFALAAKDIPSAKKFINQAIALEEQTEGKENISSRYGLASEIYAQSDKPELGLEYGIKAYQLDSIKGDTISMGKRLSQTGDAYKALSRLDEAEQSYLKAEQFLKDSKLNSSICINYKQLGNLYEMKREKQKAINYFEKSAELARQYSMNYLLENDIHHLSKLYRDIDPQKGYAYALEALELKDSVFNEQTRRNAQEYSARYDLLNKESKIAEQESQLHTQRMWMYFLITLFVLLLALIAFYIYNRYIQKEKKQLHMKYFKALTEDYTEPESNTEQQQMKTPLAQITTAERQFLRQVNTIVEERMEDSTLSSVKMSEMLCLGQRQFNRKVKAITGDDTSTFIKVKRITRAKLLLEKTDLSIGDIQTQCGFESPSYFSKVFKDVEGMSPTEYRKNKQTKNTEN